MPVLRIDSDRFIAFATNIGLATVMANKAHYLKLVAGFVDFDFRIHQPSDYVAKLQQYLTAPVKPEPLDIPPGDKPFNDDLPPNMRPHLDEQDPKPNFGAPPTSLDLPPYDKTDPHIIWRYTRANQVITAHIAAFIIDSGWPCTDQRHVSKPLNKDPEEVYNILQEQLIEERFLKDCDPKFVGLMELIFKAFHHWWTINNPNHGPRKFGDPA